MQKELLTTKDYAAVGEEISHEMAGDFIRTHYEKHPNDIASFNMGKAIIEKILAQPGCVGMRFYNGINEIGQKTLVYIGIDADGHDIVKRSIVHEDGSVEIVNGLIADRNGNQGYSVEEAFVWWNPFTWNW